MQTSNKRPTVLDALLVLLVLLAAPIGTTRASDSGGAKAGAVRCVDTSDSEPLRHNLLVTIRSELARRGGRPLADMRESDLFLQNCIRTGDPGAPLVVKGLTYDPIRGMTEALISPAANASAVPVLVAVRYRRPRRALVVKREIRSGEAISEGDVAPVTINSGDLLAPAVAPQAVAGYVARRRLRAGEVISMSMLQPPLMVRAWRPARFTAETARFRTERTVIPLRSGMMGAQIQVRDPKTEQVLAGKVIGPDWLEAVD